MKVALYARVSSEKQDTDLSVAAQLRALREYAQKNGYEVVREFVDEAESGRTAHRPAFREMISMARRTIKPFELLLVWKYSRFARSREDSIVHKTLLRKHGVRVVSITERFDETPTGKLLEAMIESLDEFYSANLGQEVLRGMRESASRGFYMPGRTPYGYRRIKVKDGSKERPKLEPDPHEAPVVARIFQEISKGKGLKEVGKTLSAEGIAGPGRKGWGNSTLHGLATNEVYTGTLVWDRNGGAAEKPEPIRIENAWEPIIDKETFDRVQNILKQRAPARLHPRRAASRYLLSGIARCGNCHKALIGAEAKSGKFSYYVCGTLLKHGSGTCDTPYLNTQKFEGMVIDKIKEHILTAENLEELVRLVNDEMDTSAVEYRQRLDNIMAELADVGRRLDNLYDALETGKLTLSDLAPRIQALRQRQDRLRVSKEETEARLTNRKIELADKRLVARYVADLRSLLTDSPLTERKAFVRSFVKEVRVKGREAEILYTIPLQPGGPIEEKVGVLPIMHFGRPYRVRTCDTLIKSQVLCQLS